MKASLVHNLIKPASASGSLKIYNINKPASASGSLTVYNVTKPASNSVIVYHFL